MTTLPICKHCGEPIVHYPSIPVPSWQWKHADGLYSCNSAKPRPFPTYAEPVEVDANTLADKERSQ